METLSLIPPPSLISIFFLIIVPTVFYFKGQPSWGLAAPTKDPLWRRALSMFILRRYMSLSGWSFSPCPTSPSASRLVLVFPQTSTLDNIIAPLYLYSMCSHSVRKGLSKKENWTINFLGGDIITVVDREKSRDLVGSLAKDVKGRDFCVIISPEGTRKRIEKWRTGYYYLAKATGAHIGILNIDHKNKTVGIDKVIEPFHTVEKTNSFVRREMSKQHFLVPENFAFSPVQQKLYK